MSDKKAVIIGLVFMIVTLVLLVLSNVISVPMWLITFIAAIMLILTTLIYYMISRGSKQPIISTLKKAPWNFAPLILGMYILIMGLEKSGIQQVFSKLLENGNVILNYGLSSFLLSNIMNNLPMSMFYALIIDSAPLLVASKATYATIIGANLGVLLTPFGALAGLMWLELLKQNDVNVSFFSYIKKMLSIGILALFFGLIRLSLFLN
ncbi:MAG: ArsB/NhaD family transporter [Acholeplasma sp.]|nr:ArsB/NhaD family transporter [Acholeplasma sp.]